MHINKLYLFVFFCLIGLSYSCDSDKVANVPDVSHIDLDYRLVRFDQEDTQNTVAALMNKYPVFGGIYFNNVVPVLREEDPEALYQEIVGQKDFKSLVDTCQLVFSDMTTNNKELELSFRLLQHYLPEIDVPDIYTFVSGFAHQLFLFETESQKNAVGVGLDMFLGGDFPYSSVAPENPSFSDYLSRSFNRDHIARKINAMLLDDYLPQPEKPQLLDQMIRNGKILYILDQLLPLTSDTIVMEYSAEQLVWVEENELEMWAYFLKEQLFYETSSQKINKYVNASPHSPGMPPAAPGRTGNYLGWQIVKAYIKRNPETTIKALIDLKDAQEILNKARFKPRK